MKRILLSSFLFSLLVLTACQREISDEIITGGGPGSGSGGSTDYLPTTAGSEWNYTALSLGNYSLKSLGTDTTVNGKKYFEFDQTVAGVTNRAYTGKNNGVYYSYGVQEANGVPVVADYFIILKDDAVGTTWTNTLNTGFINAYYKYTVSGRDLSRTVNGRNFTSVIELTTQLLIDDPLGGGTTIPIGSGKDYYAKGVGAIESFNTVDFLGIRQTDTTRLISYTIR